MEKQFKNHEMMDQTDFIDYLSEQYKSSKSNIDAWIFEIRKQIAACNPLELLNFAVLRRFMSMGKKLSDYGESTEDFISIRSIEYIQSILVSTENYYNKDTEENILTKFSYIMEVITKIYDELNLYYLYLMTQYKKESELDEDIIEYILEAQINALIRGDRYPIFEIEHLEKLVMPHNAVFEELFSINSAQFIEGMRKLQYSLSLAKVDSLLKLKELQEENTEPDEKYEYSKIKEKVFGYSLYDVKKVTNWSNELIDNLSYRLNQCPDFFTGEYPGWPCINLPVQKKPFIKISGISYCFDYINLFDNVYRVIQKTIKELKPEYEQVWATIQKNSSEQIVLDLFEKLMPGCQSYRDNYYPKTKKEFNENDIIILYEDIVFIVEVKAGSFTYTPAMTDVQAHVKSFKDLVENADYQCERTIKYILNNEEAIFYDENKRSKFSIEKSNLAEIYSFCVTVDNISEFAAKAEKLSFIKLQNGTISISIDDLRVYADYFDSPLIFLHYLKQRKRATSVKNLRINDELEHLGTYIYHNDYAKTFGEAEADIVFPSGYREELDRYFISRFTDQITYPKPEQRFPLRIKEAISFLDGIQGNNRVKITNTFLDCSSEAREELSKSIEYALVRQKELNYMASINAFGETNLFVYIYEYGVPEIVDNRKDEYIYGNLIFLNLDKCVVLDLYYDNNNNLINIQFSIRTCSEIPESRYKELKLYGKELAKKRTEFFKRKGNIKKIGRNDACPCHSGKKYKKCCGQDE